LAVSTACGHRTTAVAMFRHRREATEALGSNKPNLFPIANNAGPRVSAAASAVKTAIAHGNPDVLKTDRRVVDMHAAAPATVSADATIIGKTPDIAVLKASSESLPALRASWYLPTRNTP